jgi:hypothetical protein
MYLNPDLIEIIKTAIICLTILAGIRLWTLRP